MKKKKSMIKGMFNLGMQTSTQSIALAALPQNDVTKSTLTGYEKFASTAFPASGKLLGTGVVIDVSKKLLKKTKF